MRTAANLIVAAAIFSMISLLSASAHAESSGPTGTSGNKVAVPPGSKVTVNGAKALISGGNVTGGWLCSCGSTGSSAGCVVLQEPNYIRCTKRIGDTTCKQGCVLSTFQANGLSPGGLPKATVAPASPGSSVAPSAGSRSAPATR